MPDGLQIAWFFLLAVLLAGYAVLDGFDLGVGMLHLFLARTDRERRLLMNAVGPVWDGNEVWLLTFGGALFAAFPPVYATVFSGLYVPLMLVLTALIFRAVSLEFRSKDESLRWRSAWDVAFAAGSFLPSLLFGVALGNVCRGLPLSPDGEFAGTFASLLNPLALLCGAVAVALFALHGAGWILLKTRDGMDEKARRAARGAWVAVAVLWPVTLLVSRREAPHLWTAFGDAPSLLFPALFHLAFLAIPVALSRGRWQPFALSAAALAGLVGTIARALYPRLVPALGDLSRSFTIANASSTPGTLRTMLVIALLGVPVVLAYTAFIYWSFRGPVREGEQVY